MNSELKKIFESFDFKISDYPKLVERIKKQISSKVIILLDGPVGSGKTTLVNQLCDSLGVGFANSPTYAIHQAYQNSDITVDHFDLYRLENAEDVESIGLWDIFSKDKGLVIVEWSSKIDLDEWPIDWKILKIEFLKKEEKRAVLVFSE